MPELPFVAVTYGNLQNHLKLRKKFRFEKIFPNAQKFVHRFSVRSELDFGLNGADVDRVTPAMGLMMQLGENNWLDLDGEYLLYKHKIGMDLKFAQLSLVAVAGWDFMYKNSVLTLQLGEIKPMRAILTGAAAILAMGMYVQGSSEVVSKRVAEESSLSTKLSGEVKAGIQRRGQKTHLDIQQLNALIVLD
eukprot:TRINITY_DN3002_c0_g1_i1.p2 TRINITY_DN3002_c0_g1~~TRINITY_DN3002_c0_g1_i1.p2  ORF type:complete len:191 (+),score=35.25 TRINITY_DN3002_c0_g1_i1:190-762(+)